MADCTMEGSKRPGSEVAVLMLALLLRNLKVPFLWRLLCMTCKENWWERAKRKPTFSQGISLLKLLYLIKLWSCLSYWAGIPKVVVTGELESGPGLWHIYRALALSWLGMSCGVSGWELSSFLVAGKCKEWSEKFLCQNSFLCVFQLCGWLW